MVIVRPASELSGPVLSGAVAGLTVAGGAAVLGGATTVVGATVVVVTMVVVVAAVVAVARRRGGEPLLPIATATPAIPSATTKPSSAMSRRRLMRHGRSRDP